MAAIATPLSPNEPSEHIELLHANTFPKSIQIVGDHLILPQRLQKILKLEITRAQKKLTLLNQETDMTNRGAIGLVYFHKGQDFWQLEFIYEGFVLETTPSIILTTKQINMLEVAFKQTQWVKIKNITYPTTGDLQRVGPILLDTHTGLLDKYTVL